VSSSSISILAFFKFKALRFCTQLIFSSDDVSRAREDRKRYEEQMAKYQPPDKQANRKRNKTGYNMFFSAHVLRLKQSESGVPSERGSVARLVGNAWKQLSAEEKQYYEREADKHNGMNPVEKDDDEDDDEAKRPIAEYAGQYAPPTDMQYAAMPPPAHGQAMHQPTPDPRYYHPHGHWGQAPPHGYYEHHAQATHGAQTPRGAYVQPARGHQHYQYPPQVYHQQPPGRSEYRGSQEM
jgi:HMG-box domain